MPKILICDDEMHIRMLMEQTLEEFEDEGVELLTAADGESALAQIREHRPRIVFLDIMMPRVNGFEVCRTVTRDWQFSDTTIIMLTAKGQEYDRAHGKEMGADRYMTKPFDPDAIVGAVREILG